MYLKIGGSEGSMTVSTNTVLPFITKSPNVYIVVSGETRDRSNPVIPGFAMKVVPCYS
jgi:hypothetical protein